MVIVTIVLSALFVVITVWLVLVKEYMGNIKKGFEKGFKKGYNKKAVRDCNNYNCKAKKCYNRINGGPVRTSPPCTGWTDGKDNFIDNLDEYIDQSGNTD